MFSEDSLAALLLILLGLPFLGGLVLLISRCPLRWARISALVLAGVQLAITVGIVAAAVPILQEKSEFFRKYRPQSVVDEVPVMNPIAVPGAIRVPNLIARADAPVPPPPQSGPGGTMVPPPPPKTVEVTRTSIELLPLSSRLAASDNRATPTGIRFFLGLDGINLWLVALSSVILLPVVLISWNHIQERAAEFYGWLFILNAAVVGVFLAMDAILFYVFFELTLIPMFFLIGIWGTGSLRREAARKFFLYTLSGSLISLLGILGVVLVCYDRTGILTFSIPDLAEIVRQQTVSLRGDALQWWLDAQTILFLTLVAGFAVKIPLIPLHSWLPITYSEAPIGVTMMLSALLAKMGTYGLVRLCLPLTPDAVLSIGLPLLGILAAIGIIYGSLCAYAQKDLKRMIAYSSVAHLGFCVLGLLAFNAEGIAGGVLHMVNHGLSTGALFLLVGLLAERYTSQQIADNSGIWNRLPVLTFFMMMMCLASVGLPGLNNFVSEMLMLGALCNLRSPSVSGYIFAAVAAFGIFLSAWYLLTMLQRMFFGPLKESAPKVSDEPIQDLNGRELAAIAPLAALCLFLGLFPQFLMDSMQRDVQSIAQVAEEARQRAGVQQQTIVVAQKP